MCALLDNLRRNSAAVDDRYRRSTEGAELTRKFWIEIDLPDYQGKALVLGACDVVGFN